MPIARDCDCCLHRNEPSSPGNIALAPNASIGPALPGFSNYTPA